MCACTHLSMYTHACQTHTYKKQCNLWIDIKQERSHLGHRLCEGAGMQDMSKSLGTVVNLKSTLYLLLVPGKSSDIFFLYQGIQLFMSLVLISNIKYLISF